MVTGGRQGQRVTISLDQESKRLLERIVKALEKQQNTTIIIQSHEDDSTPGK